MGSQASTEKGPRVKLIEPNFYHIRAEFRVVSGLINVGTHMSLVKLPTGKFLVIDTVPVDHELKLEIDELTNGGQDIEAVVATHPFHTLAFPAFFEMYPNARYFGTPRHLRNQKQVDWAGDITNALSEWESSGVFMRIPDGAEWFNPQPESSNHFNAVWVFVQDAKLVHVDDTVGLYPDPGFLLKVVGFKANTLCFHPALKGPGLVPHPDSPAKFKAWLEKLLEEWDFDKIACAHKDTMMSGAKDALRATLAEAQPILDSLTKQFAKSHPNGDSNIINDEENKEADMKHSEDVNAELQECKKANVEGNECG
eukprot:TRINITY_DN17548_c0_g1_i1.p1 TRINITY_DN17548_c0_g1~~TRINITY_DN17548_c0_g1_i1.p1  ORF type:complete len:311 (+),score=89.41 TRINITY_DN17548_c0_g1_i1:178-1110(+)